MQRAWACSGSFTQAEEATEDPAEPPALPGQGLGKQVCLCGSICLL